MYVLISIGSLFVGIWAGFWYATKVAERWFKDFLNRMDEK